MSLDDHMAKLADEVRQTWLEYALYVVEMECGPDDPVGQRIKQRIIGTLNRLGTKREQALDLDQNEPRGH
jgi:hypothetical protein